MLSRDHRRDVFHFANAPADLGRGATSSAPHGVASATPPKSSLGEAIPVAAPLWVTASPVLGLGHVTRAALSPSAQPKSSLVPLNNRYPSSACASVLRRHSPCASHRSSAAGVLCSGHPIIANHSARARAVFTPANLATSPRRSRRGSLAALPSADRSPAIARRGA